MYKSSPSRTRSRYGAALGFALALLFVAASNRTRKVEAFPPQGDTETVTQTAVGNPESWRIEKPNVQQRLVEYKQIRFRGGDNITIQAGGCVQTGGHGSTWKRYVNPTGPNADHMYHGLIWIPGVIGGPATFGAQPTPQRIVAYTGANQSVTVPPGADVLQLYLRLGYEDDVYHDNGYSDHDDGTQDQCKGVGNAFVMITIKHASGSPPPPSGVNPFDLVWNSEDDNGIPLNAKWGWQVTHPHAFPDPAQCTGGPFKSPCTSWNVDFNVANFCTLEQYKPGADNSPPLFGVPGHGNWATATYDGNITFEAHSAPGTDDDYNFEFYPRDDAGLTTVRDSLETEFDSDETIDHFTTPWWNTFHQTVDKGDFDASQLVHGRYAIVTGLVGLDFSHYGISELHPVWAIAMRVKDYDAADEVWAIFVRRIGDEGFCSSDLEQLSGLPNDTYTFRLPWRPGASDVRVGSGTTFLAKDPGASGPSLQSAQNQGLLVSFRLSEGNRINGELHLQWIGGREPAPVPGRQEAPLGPIACDKCASQGSDCYELRNGNQTIYQRCIAQCKKDCQGHEQGDPEARVGSLLASMTPAKRNQFLALSARPPVARDAQGMNAGAVVRIQSLPRRAARPPRRQYSTVANLQKRARDQRMIDVLKSR